MGLREEFTSLPKDAFSKAIIGEALSHHYIRETVGESGDNVVTEEHEASIEGLMRDFPSLDHFIRWIKNDYGEIAGWTDEERNKAGYGAFLLARAIKIISDHQELGTSPPEIP